MIKKITGVARSYLNDWIKKVEDPEKLLNQSLGDLKDQQRKAKQDLAEVIAEERKLKSQTEEEAKKAQEWEEKAQIALKSGREDLAKEALRRRHEAADRAREFYATWQKQCEEVDKFKEAVRKMAEDLDTKERQKGLLVAKHKRAQANLRIHDTITGISDKSAFATFERMALKIEDNERLALVTGELDEEFGKDPLEKEFLTLESSSAPDVDRQLLLMKQHMGLLGTGTEPELKTLPSFVEEPMEGPSPEKIDESNKIIKRGF